MIRNIFFDLDATLLPMDQDQFVKEYFSRLTGYLVSNGYEQEDVAERIWTGTMRMVKNTGEKTNEHVFWECFNGGTGPRDEREKKIFESFYRTEFQKAKVACRPTGESRRLVDRLKADGYTLILATNPVFPAIATECRIRWAGLEPSDFVYRTTYENSSFCKPNPDYFRELLEKLELRPEESLMIGNDARDDEAAEKAGMQVFLLTDCLINTRNADISRYPQGGFAELWAFIQTLRGEL